MSRPYPQGPALTPDEEKTLWDNQVIFKLTKDQWEAFGAWVGANDPGPLEAKHWITKENNLDLNMFSLQCLRLMIKQAKFKWHGQTSEDDEADEASGNFVVRRPGFGLPLGHMPDEGDRFPLLFMENSYGDGWRAATLLIRECCMLKLVDELSDKPEWWRKVKDDEIAGKWKKEALAIDWESYLPYADFTPAMADACISELRRKADLYEKTGLMPVYDYSAAVIKSDSIMTPELAKSLQEAVRPLEDVPPEHKDWHPNSDEQVLDLVHPSLWPLVYGRSRALRDRVIGLQDALAHCGTGTLLRAPGKEETIRVKKPGSFCPEDIVVLSNQFQWLPCDVEVDPTTGSAKIASYINNLHPVEHAHLYPVIERFIEKSLPAWDVVYRWHKSFAVQRLKTDEVGVECPCPEICSSGYGQCKPWKRPLNEGEVPRGRYEPGGSRYEDYDYHDSEEEEPDEDDEEIYASSERKKLDDAWFASTHSTKLPDADPKADEHIKIEASDVKSQGFFDNQKQIQVIVKLANIHLTPEKPSYRGGLWHTEGQLNEHIVSTALYYYDSDNITDCTLSFRTCANAEELEAELNYEQNEHEAIGKTFAIRTDGDIFQEIGSVRTRADRALFFPNLLQHRVSPFKLADPTKPGHRKILALFLVDPAIPITSTSNVPPQQKHWWIKQTKLHLGEGRVPPEIAEMVTDGVEWPMGLEEAKELRLGLMSDRTWLQGQEQDGLEREEWNFCEH